MDDLTGTLFIRYAFRGRRNRVRKSWIGSWRSSRPSFLGSTPTGEIGNAVWVRKILESDLTGRIAKVVRVANANSSSRCWMAVSISRTSSGFHNGRLSSDEEGSRFEKIYKEQHQAPVCLLFADFS
jgi:hypothetical protein